MDGFDSDEEEEEKYGIEDLIYDLESGSSDIGYGDIDDFEDDDEDYTLDDLMKDLESNADEDSDLDFVESEVLGDFNLSNRQETRKHNPENFVSIVESGNEFNLEPIPVENNSESVAGENSYILDDGNSLIVEEEGNPNIDVLDNDVNSLKIKNESIKLDLWLEKCVNQKYIDSFLKYNSIKIEIGNSPLDYIVSNFELEDLLKFKYKSNLNEFVNSLKVLFLPLGIMQLIDIAKKYDVSISFTKDGLISNFLKKFTMYELVLIFNEEGLKINDYLNISVLEQIYLSSLSKLGEISKKSLPDDSNLKYDMISSIVNQYDQEYLISDEIFKGDDL